MDRYIDINMDGGEDLYTYLHVNVRESGKCVLAFSTL